MEYWVPFVKPPMTSGDAVTAELGVTHEPVPILYSYSVIADPPLNAGSSNAIETCPLPGVSTNDDGASGVVRGVAVTAADSALAPTLLMARILKL